MPKITSRLRIESSELTYTNTNVATKVICKKINKPPNLAENPVIPYWYTYRIKNYYFPIIISVLSLFCYYSFLPC